MPRKPSAPADVNSAIHHALIQWKTIAFEVYKCYCDWYATEVGWIAARRTERSIGFDNHEFDNRPIVLWCDQNRFDPRPFIDFEDVANLIYCPSIPQNLLPSREDISRLYDRAVGLADRLIRLCEAEKKAPVVNHPKRSSTGKKSDFALVTLSQVSGLVGRSKRTLDGYLQKGKLPPPDVKAEEGDGRPHQWYWKTLKPALEKEFNLPRKLPDIFPGTGI